MCLAIGLLSVTGGVGAALLLAHATDVSTYAVNIVTLIGLGIAIDYSLFIVSRFREELANGRTVEEAVAVAMGTAGRAIAFSGLTVAIGLAAMLFYRGTFLVSMGICGAMVVAISVLLGLTFLPALLSVLGPRINRLSVPVLRPRPFGQGMWHRIAVAVMRRPVIVLVPTVAVLLAAGRALPAPPPRQHRRHPAARLTPRRAQGAELLASAFPGPGQPTSSRWWCSSTSGVAAVARQRGRRDALSRRLPSTPGVAAVRSYVDVDPTLTLAAYQHLYAGRSVRRCPPRVRDEVTRTVGRNIAVLDAVTPSLPASDAAARAGAHDPRRGRRSSGATVVVTGDTAFDIDFVNYIVQQTPVGGGLRDAHHASSCSSCCCAPWSCPSRRC